VLTKKTHQLLYATRLNGLRDKITLKAHPAFEDCKILKLAFGAYHMFVLTEEGVVFTLGDNEVGQQGIPISTVKIIKTPMQTEILS
jgi:alpha-tubulin suppressor-like RCC1 family protein